MNLASCSFKCHPAFPGQVPVLLVSVLKSAFLQGFFFYLKLYMLVFERLWHQISLKCVWMRAVTRPGVGNRENRESSRWAAPLLGRSRITFFDICHVSPSSLKVGYTRLGSYWCCRCCWCYSQCNCILYCEFIYVFLLLLIYQPILVE